jgi:ABC-type polar amino acid transport system ATPase subunit
MKPELMLYDNPLPPLDPEMIRKCWKAELSAEGMTSMVVTHEWASPAGR